MFRIFIAFTALFFSQIGCAQTQLPPHIESLLNKNNIKPQSLSVIAISAQSENPSLSFQANKMVSPASTMKLLTSFIALDILGPTFQWKTQFLSEQAIQNGQLKGNLYLRGGGDPNLTWDKLAVMLRNLRQQGLQKIDGDIVADRSYFEPRRPEINAPIFDENPEAYYNVIPDALLIHSNITGLSIHSSNNQINAQLLTPMSDVNINNRLSLNKRPCTEWKNDWRTPTFSTNSTKNSANGDYGDYGADQITMSFAGSFPRNCQIKEYVNVMERNSYIGNMIRTLWMELGGTWNGKVVDGVTPNTANLLTERLSETLAETIRIVNKFSDNSMARIVFMTIGAQSSVAKNFADTNQAANAVVREWLAAHHISDTSLSIENGSGLSRTDRISAQQLASILKVAYQNNWYAEFANSLPIAAVDGSMKNRLMGTTAQGRARIKTGYLKNVLSIAGYVRDMNNQDWIIVAMMNTDDNINVSKAKPVLDELILWLANGAVP